MSYKIDFRLVCFVFCSLSTVAFGFFLSPFWSAVVGILTVWFLVHFIIKKSAAEFLALPRSLKNWGACIGYYIAGLLLFFCVQKSLAQLNPNFEARWSHIALSVFLVVPIQSFYEEIVFRGIVLRHLFLERNLPPVFGIVVVGIFFSLTHWLNYNLTEGVILHISTLIALFFLGSVGNILFYQQGHLGGAWGFHAGWNSLRFSFIYALNNQALSEGQSFNALEGSAVGLIFSSVIFLVAKKRVNT